MSSPYSVKAFHDTYFELQDKLNQVGQYLAKWGMDQAEIASEVFEAFAHAYRKYDPTKGKPFEDWAGEIVYYRCRANVRDRTEKQHKLNKLRVNGRYAMRVEVDGEPWEAMIPSPAEDRTTTNGLSKLQGDGATLVQLIVDPPAPLWKEFQKWSNYGSASPKYAWKRALSVYLKTKHWTKTPWSDKRIKEAFHSVTQALQGEHYHADK